MSKKNDRYFIKTVEGNTSDGSGFNRNGGCVAIKEYSFTLAEVGGTNRINGFGYPLFSDDTCTVSEFVEVLKSEVGYTEKASKEIKASLKDYEHIIKPEMVEFKVDINSAVDKAYMIGRNRKYSRK